MSKCASSKLRPSYETTRPPFVGGKKNGEKYNDILRKPVSRNIKVISIFVSLFHIQRMIYIKGYI